MNRSPGILSPSKSSDGRSSESPDEEPEETFASRAREEIAETKTGSKFVRVLTVMAYVLCVSMAAILLSLYYVLLWDPPKHNHDPDTPSALRADRGRMEMDYDMINRSYWRYYNQMNSIEEPTPIPVLQANIFTTPNSSFDYGENEKFELEIPDYEDTFTILNNNTIAEKEKRYVSTNITADNIVKIENFVLKRLKSIMYNSTNTNTT